MCVFFFILCKLDGSRSLSLGVTVCRGRLPAEFRLPNRCLNYYFYLKCLFHSTIIVIIIFIVYLRLGQRCQTRVGLSYCAWRWKNGLYTENSMHRTDRLHMAFPLCFFPFRFSVFLLFLVSPTQLFPSISSLYFFTCV